MNAVKSLKVFARRNVANAMCQIALKKALLSYLVNAIRFQGLHPARQAAKHERIGRQLRSSDLAVELAYRRLENVSKY